MATKKTTKGARGTKKAVRRTRTLSSEPTPGPWVVTGHNIRANTEMGDGALVALVKDHWANVETPEDEKVATAMLIAAAPALYAALQEVTWDIEAYCNDHLSKSPTDVTVCLPKLRAALHKAEHGEV